MWFLQDFIPTWISRFYSDENSGCLQCFIPTTRFYSDGNLRFFNEMLFRRGKRYFAAKKLPERKEKEERACVCVIEFVVCCVCLVCISLSLSLSIYRYIYTHIHMYIHMYTYIHVYIHI